MTIINFMPVHRQAPVALWLLKKDVAAAAEKIAEAGAQAVLMPAGDEVSATLADALGESCRVIECDPSRGFVYANGSAAAKMLDGEKPLPSCCEGDGADRCLNGSELLAAEGKRWVWFDGADEPVEVDRVVSAESLVAAAGADDAKAVGIGYPSGPTTPQRLSYAATTCASIPPKTAWQRRFWTFARCTVTRAADAVSLATRALIRLRRFLPISAARRVSRPTWRFFATFAP